MSTTPKHTRATKKQYELLSFIDGFIKGNGYGPSYREIMRALDYRSVSTVATHVTGLITKGYLEKTDDSARSLRVVTASSAANPHSLTWLTRELAAKRTHAQQENDESSVQAIDRVAQLFGIDLNLATSK